MSSALSVSVNESEGEGRSYKISDCSALGSSLVLTSWLKMTLGTPANEKSELIAGSGNSFVSRC